jgi:hypothetical protein
MSYFTRKHLASAALCAVIAAAAAPSYAQTFTFTTLDNPGDPTFNQLLGINDSGVITGYFGSGAAGHPNIGYEISPPYTSYTSNMQPGSVQTQATGINNAGLTTGFWAPTNLGMNDANFGFVREPTGTNFTYISATDPLVSSVPTVDQALGINNNNIVAGFYNDANGNTHGYTYSLATAAYTPVSINGATSTAATGINDNNVISGFYVTPKGATFGFTRNASGGVVTHFKVPGTNFTQLLGINNEGVAVGFYMQHGVPHGLYYTPATGAWTPVNDPSGSMGTVVNGINNKNQLVGFYIDAAGNTHGMIVNVTP